MLTVKQYRLLTLINDSIKTTGVTPSFEEMKESLGLRSKSGIHRLVFSLEERGFIRRLPYKARAIEVLKMPTETALNVPTEKDKAKISNSKNINIIMPFLGKIATGTRADILNQVNKNIEVPEGMIGRGDHYALEMDGDSMVEAGILSGDTVIIKKTSKAAEGAIVIALVNGAEITLQKLYKSKGKVCLEPANSKYKSKTYNPDQVEIKGQLVGLLRNY